uniref:Uncharacterized protein n=1 Tax=Arundo donax TaxID=35708 RepID=A0A0A9F7Y2_ARUDO
MLQINRTAATARDATKYLEKKPNSKSKVQSFRIHIKSLIEARNGGTSSPSMSILLSHWRVISLANEDAAAPVAPCQHCRGRAPRCCWTASRWSRRWWNLSACRRRVLACPWMPGRWLPAHAPLLQHNHNLETRNDPTIKP